MPIKPKIKNRNKTSSSHNLDGVIRELKLIDGVRPVTHELHSQLTLGGLDGGVGDAGGDHGAHEELEVVDDHLHDHAGGHALYAIQNNDRVENGGRYNQNHNITFSIL